MIVTYDFTYKKKLKFRKDNKISACKNMIIYNNTKKEISKAIS